MNKKVLIAVPTFENIKPDCFKSIYGQERVSGFDYFFDFIKGYDCAKARNMIAKEAVEGDYDYVLMVDSDIQLPHDALANLLSHDKDIVVGWYMRKRTVNDLVEVFKFGQNYTDKNQYRSREIRELDSELVPIKGAGLGIVLIKTSYLKQTITPWFRYIIYDSENRKPGVYEDKKVLSEDLYFCSQAINKGVNVFLDPRVKGTHIFDVYM